MEGKGYRSPLRLFKSRSVKDAWMREFNPELSDEEEGQAGQRLNLK